MSAHKTNARVARRNTSRHAGRRGRNRIHRHVVALFPEPWGAVPLPIVYSVGAYERQFFDLHERTGCSGFGGPVIGFCRCRQPDSRLPSRGRALPYWQIEIDPATAEAIRAAHEAEIAEIMKRPSATWFRELFGDEGDEGDEVDEGDEAAFDAEVQSVRPKPAPLRDRLAHRAETLGSKRFEAGSPDAEERAAWTASEDERNGVEA